MKYTTHTKNEGRRINVRSYIISDIMHLVYCSAPPIYTSKLKFVF